MISSSEKGICIYHGDCPDGFGAAWVVHKLYPNYEYVSASYDGTVPDVAGKHVFIVDYSYPPKVLIEMAKVAQSILMIDHHKSAIDAYDESHLSLPDNVHVVLDDSQCGAALTFDRFYPYEALPDFLRHLQDRDLWRFELPKTHEVVAALMSYPYDFETWDILAVTPIYVLIEEGRHIMRDFREKLHRHIDHAKSEAVIYGYRVPIINAPHFMGSYLCEELSVGKPFAAYYWDGRHTRNFGLASSKDGMDVERIAKRFGGGGHKHAAGFKIPLTESIELL